MKFRLDKSLESIYYFGFVLWLCIEYEETAPKNTIDFNFVTCISVTQLVYILSLLFGEAETNVICLGRTPNILNLLAAVYFLTCDVKLKSLKKRF